MILASYMLAKSQSNILNILFQRKEATQEKRSDILGLSIIYVNY